MFLQDLRNTRCITNIWRHGPTLTFKLLQRAHLEKLAALQKASRFMYWTSRCQFHTSPRKRERERKESFYLFFFFSLSRARTLFISEKGVEINGKRETERERGRRGIDNRGNPLRPQTHPGHYFAIDIPHDGVPWFRLEGCLLWQQGSQVAGIDVRRHPLTLQRADVIAYVLDHLLAAHAKFIDIHDAKVPRAGIQRFSRRSIRANTRLIRHERDILARRTRVRDFLLIFFYTCISAQMRISPLSSYICFRKGSILPRFCEDFSRRINSFEQKEMWYRWTRLIIIRKSIMKVTSWDARVLN